MKSSPLPFIRCTITGLIAATLALPCPDSAAQESKPSRAPSSVPAPTAGGGTGAGGEARPKIEITNGSIEELAQLLEGQFEGANFVVPQPVANVRVTLKLRNVNLDQVLQA